MNIFLLYVFLFFIGSLFGWVLELFYRRPIEGRWMNPGFLTGPYLPIYGFGLCTLYSIAAIGSRLTLGSLPVQILTVFAVSGVLMTLIELIAGKIFILGFKVKLWDYTNEFCNYKGIICLKFSLIWAALGTVYYFFVNPYITDAILWFTEHLAFSFVLGIFFGVFMIDVVYSCNIIIKIREFAKKNDLLVRYEELKLSVRTAEENYREKGRRLRAFIFSSLQIHNHLDAYKERLRSLKNKGN